MLITTLDTVPQLPDPPLGLQGAVHTSSVADVSSISTAGALSAAPSSCAGQVFLNGGSSAILIPPAGGYPARKLAPGEYVTSNGAIFYKVTRKASVSMPIASVASGVFTALDAAPDLSNGTHVVLAGFRNPAGFSNDETYTVTGLSGNTFSLTNSSGTPLSSASATAGWLHTAGTNSFYPSMFERTAYSLAFTPNSLSYGTPYTIQRAFSFRAIATAAPVVYSVIFEFGDRIDDTAPLPIGPNISGYSWRPPALEQQVVLTDVTSQHALGLTFSKNTDGTWSGVRLLYSQALPLIPGTLPKTNNFICRVRLGQFDTINSSADQSGYIAYLIQDITKIPTA